VAKSYKEPIETEIETTINVIYNENILSIYTNKVNLQKSLCKTLGKPTQEYKRGRSILASRWDVSLDEKNKISQMMLKSDIFNLNDK
jgi:hypothetical protein